MGTIRTNDFLAEVDSKGRFVRSILPPQPSLIPDEKIVNGKRVVVGVKKAHKGYYQPSKVDGTNNEIADFGAYHARKFRHDKRKRRFS